MLRKVEDAIWRETVVAPWEFEAEEGKFWFIPRKVVAAACDEAVPVTRTVEGDVVWGEAWFILREVEDVVCNKTALGMLGICELGLAAPFWGGCCTAPVPQILTTCCPAAMVFLSLAIALLTCAENIWSDLSS